MGPQVVRPEVRLFRRAPDCVCGRGRYIFQWVVLLDILAEEEGFDAGRWGVGRGGGREGEQ